MTSLLPDKNNIRNDDIPQSLVTHLAELRRRLIYCLCGFGAAFIPCYAYSEKLFSFLVHPLAALLQERVHHRLIYTGLAEAFLAYIKVGAFAAGFLSFPLIASQIWIFIAPGLYQKERQIFIALLAATPVLFLAGAAFAYYIVFPSAYVFFISFETPVVAGQLPLVLEARISEYLSFVMRLVLAFGISFELPVLLMLLASIDRVSSKALVSRWRFAILGIFSVAAVVTPPDLCSMIGLAIPLMFLYAVSILMVKAVESRRPLSL